MEIFRKILLISLLVSLFLPRALHGSLVAEWKFDGYSLEDNSGNGHTGHLVNSARIVNSGHNCEGLYLPNTGSDYDHMYTDDAPDLKITGNLTIMLWIYKTSNYTSGLVTKNYNPESSAGLLNEYWFGIVGDGDLVFGDNAIDSFMMVNTNLGTNQWYHVAVVRDVNNHQVCFYVNGNQVACYYYGADGADPSNYKVSVGACVPCCAPFKGYIDEVKIYDEPLSDSEIQNIYNCECGGTCDDCGGGSACDYFTASITGPDTIDVGETVEFRIEVDKSNNYDGSPKHISFDVYWNTARFSYVSVTSGFSCSAYSDHIHCCRNDYDWSGSYTYLRLRATSPGQDSVYLRNFKVEGNACDTGNDCPDITASKTVTINQSLANISGYVYEDVNGDGDMSDREPAQNVTVKLFRTDGTLVSTTSTNSDGRYTFTGVQDGNYYIVVDSRTIQPAEGFNSGFGIGDVWAEQTYVYTSDNGSSYARGLWDDDADSSTAPAQVSGAHVCFGGAYGNRSDDASTLDGAEHKIFVHVENGDNLDNENFGFSFNVVTNVNDRDDDASNNRTCQGCLRQFIQNANAISGGNTMRFVPVVPKNSGNWWTVTLNLTYNSTEKYILPPIDDNGTVVDGTAFNYTDGTTVINSNSGSISAPGPVGVDRISLSSYEKPELEIDGNGLGHVFIIDSSATIQNVSIYNTGWDTDHYCSGVYIFGKDVYVTNNYIGVRADGAPPDISEAVMDGVFIRKGGKAYITHNFIGYTADAGIVQDGEGIIARNYITHTGRTAECADGITFEYVLDDSVTRERDSVVVEDNYIEYSAAYGIETWGAPGAFKLINNTVTKSGRGNVNGDLCGDGNRGTTELGGVRLFGSGSLVEKNVIFDNLDAGVVVVALGNDKPSKRNTITQNEFYNNGGLAIDLDQTHTEGVNGSVNPNGDMVSPNDGGKNSNQQNEGLDYPIISSATLSGNTLHIEGFVGTPSQKIEETLTIEIYKADNDGNNNGEIISGDGESVPHGEGHWYIGTCTTDANGNFSCDLTIPSDVTLSAGDSVTATATDANGNTSEFSSNVLVSVLITGRVFEDIDGEGESFSSADGDEGKANVLVRLYRDINGNDSLDAADIFVDSARTNSNGEYELKADSKNATFFVVVNSKDIQPKAGYNSGAGYGLYNVWAEQTYEREYINESYSSHTEFGGENPEVSDSFSLTSTDVADNRYEHVARVDVDTLPVSGIDLGFNFNVVVNTLDSDQDAGSPRFAQGSLRQFIINANGITGPNHMRFVPAVPPNSGSGSNRWWTVTASFSLPGLTDSRTVIDGTAYSSSDGTTVRDDNPGTFAGNVNVGTGDDGVPNTGDEYHLNSFEKLEFEINLNDNYSLRIFSDSCAIYKVAVYNGGGETNWQQGANADISILGLTEDDGADSNSIRDCIVNARADGSDLSPDECATEGIRIFGGSYNRIKHNYINRAKIHHIVTKGSDGTDCISGNCAPALFNIIEENEITRGDPIENWGDGISLDLNSDSNVVRYNYIHDLPGGGIEIWSNSDNDSIYENTITNCHTIGSTNDDWGVGISCNSNDNVVKENLIFSNQGDGVSVDSCSSRNKISKNSIYNNQELGIDLNRDGVTPNDGSTGSKANNGMDYPIFTRATLNGNILHIEGYVGTPLNLINRVSTVEVFKADNDGNNNGEVISGDGESLPHGEGHWFIGTCTTDANGNFSCDLTIPSGVSLTVGDSITATATDADGNTSEFSANYPVSSPGPSVVVKGYVYHDVNHNMNKDDSESGISGVRVELWYWNGSNWVEENDTITDCEGYYEFTPSHTGKYRIIEDFEDHAGSDPDHGADSTDYVSTTPNVVEIQWDASGYRVINFGDFRGAKFTGKVFYDATCNQSVSTNNNGIYDSGEPAISGVTITAENSGGVISQATTDENGDYTLWIPYGTTTPFYVIEHQTTSFISTGDKDGIASSTNPYGPDSIRVSGYNPGMSYSGYDFGDVTRSIFEPDHSGSGMPGASIYYSHILISGTETNIVISNSSSLGWNWVLIHDVNANGVLDGSDTLISNNFKMLPCDTMHIIVRTFIPSDVPVGQTDVTIFFVNAEYQNNSYLVDSLKAVDITALQGPLKITKSVDKNQALPGDTLIYTITYKNMGTEPVDSISLSDPISSYVIFVENSFGVNNDVEFHYPSGTVIYLKAEEGTDTNGDGAWIMMIGSTKFLRVDFWNLDSNSPGPIERLQAGEEGYLRYKVVIR